MKKPRKAIGFARFLSVILSGIAEIQPARIKSRVINPIGNHINASTTQKITLQFLLLVMLLIMATNMMTKAKANSPMIMTASHPSPQVPDSTLQQP